MKIGDYVVYNQRSRSTENHNLYKIIHIENNRVDLEFIIRRSSGCLNSDISYIELASEDEITKFISWKLQGFKEYEGN